MVSLYKKRGWIKIRPFRFIDCPLILFLLFKDEHYVRIILRFWESFNLPGLSQNRRIIVVYTAPYQELQPRLNFFFWLHRRFYFRYSRLFILVSSIAKGLFGFVFAGTHQECWYIIWSRIFNSFTSSWICDFPTGASWFLRFFRLGNYLVGEARYGSDLRPAASNCFFH